MASRFLARGGSWVFAQTVLLGIASIGPWLWTRIYLFPVAVHLGIGVTLMVLGLTLLVWGAVSLGSSLTPLPHPRDDSSLKSGGVYGLVRHPIYAGLILMVTGYAFNFPSLGQAIAAITIFVFFDRKASREERWLRERYPQYEATMKHARKLVPWIY